MNYKHIAWDWNGTLLNDAQAVAGAVDRMLAGRGLGSLSLKDYQAKISFPVINLYYDSGFDLEKERYEDICDEYIANYRNNHGLIALHTDAVRVLEAFDKRGLQQHVISASEQTLLKEQVAEYGLSRFFESIFGQTNHQADSKLHLALRFIEETGCNPAEVLFIGDTTHDYEVARGAGFDCVLIANGHCSRERLEATGAPVFSSLDALCRSDIFK